MKNKENKKKEYKNIMVCCRLQATHPRKAYPFAGKNTAPLCKSFLGLSQSIRSLSRPRINLQEALPLEIGLAHRGIVFFPAKGYPLVKQQQDTQKSLKVQEIVV
jgi:hypothetical protein